MAYIQWMIFVETPVLRGELLIIWMMTNLAACNRSRACIRTQERSFRDRAGFESCDGPEVDAANAAVCG
jgi:uncharacterized Fe-S cluster protein YjdI